MTIPNGEIGTSLGAYKQDNTLNALNIIFGSVNASISLQEGLLDAVGQKISDFGKCGKLMSVGGKAFGAVGTGLSLYSGAKAGLSGDNRGWLDMGMAATGGIVAPVLMYYGLLSNPVGWTIIGVTAVYGIGTAIYDYKMNEKQ